jgi:hypothetical protein
VTARIPLALAAVVAVLLLVGSDALPALLGKPLSAGGSNYDFYRLVGCDREPYGVIGSFSKGRSTIESQLAAMYANGQRRLRIGIFHQHAPDSGATMDSSTGDLSPADRSQLTGLLAAVKAAGFVEIEVAFFPIGADDPHGWDDWQESSYREDWSVIQDLHPLIAAAGIPYRIDLLNEGIPTASEPVLLRYSHTLWAAYTRAFGATDSVGFSMTVPLTDRVPQLPAVYGSHPPAVFDVHLYGSFWHGDEYQQFLDADAAMTRLGYHQPWVIGETWFNDPDAATAIDRAIARTDRPVRYLTQWPLTRAATCPDVDVPAPVAFQHYRS